MIRSLVLCLGLLPGLALATPFDRPAQLDGADIVMLGEIHDNPAHHVWQGEMLEALRPSAIVFEMLSPRQATLVTPALLADLDALSEAIDWSNSGWPDFSLYRPVFDGVGAARIFGAALPRDRVRDAVRTGAAAQFSGDPARFGLTLALPDNQRTTRESLQMEAHCNALPENLLGGMVEAQRLRDAALAQAVLQALQETGGPVVLIAGNGHVRTDWGVPQMIALAESSVSVIAVGQFETEYQNAMPVDLWRVTDPAERDDPCAGFNRS